MKISAASLEGGLRRWAREPSKTREALQHALEIVNRDLPEPRALEEIAGALLLTMARRHEGRVESALGRLEGALGRLLDDVEAIHSVSAQGRAPELRAADLHTVADALAEMSSFEGRVQAMIGTDAAELQASMRDIIAGGHGIAAPHPPAPAASTVPGSGVGQAAAHAAQVRPLARSRDLGRQLEGEAREVVEAWRSGRTAEPSPVPVAWRDHPILVDTMSNLRDTAARSHTTIANATDPAVAARAVQELQQSVAEARETLRGFGRRFEAVSAGDRIPPSRALGPGEVPAPGSVMADALAAEARLAGLPGPTATPTEIMDALHFSNPSTTATGALGEPIARTVAGMGQEAYVLGASGIRRLLTRPPWLAGTLARLVDGWERAHLVGPGFGGELFAGLMLAPWGVNQLAQNRGAERILRNLASASRALGGPEVAPIMTASGRRLAIPLAAGGFEFVDLLTSVHYELPRPNGPALHIDIHVNPDGSWRVTHDLPAGVWPHDIPLAGAR